MFRIKLILIGVGIFLAFMGVQEIKVSKGTSSKPAELSLAEIESGSADTSNAHIKLGEHFPAYFELIYYGEENTNKVEHVYYPILSTEHSFVQGMTSLYESHPDGDFSEDQVPKVGEFSVLVKSKRYRTTDELPDTFDIEESVQGLVVNKISKLKDEELDLLRQSFPNFDPSKVFILEEGRKPAGIGKKLGMVGGGSLLSLLGIALFFVGSRGKTA